MLFLKNSYFLFESVVFKLISLYSRSEDSSSPDGGIYFLLHLYPFSLYPGRLMSQTESILSQWYRGETHKSKKGNKSS